MPAGDQLRPALGRHAQHQHVAHEREQLAEDGDGVFSLHPHGGKGLERGSRAVLDDISQQLLDPPLAGKSHRGVDRVDVDLLMRRALVEQAQRVADAALGEAGDQLGRLAGEFEAFFPGDVRDLVGQLRRFDAAEVVALAAREDRRGDLLQLGRGEDEDQMLRRLLDDLQQRVEGREREHVHLVDDIDALLHRGGREHGLLAQGADVVHAVVGGGVKLDHVEDRAVGILLIVFQPVCIIPESLK